MSNVTKLSTFYIKREILKLCEQMQADAYDFEKPIDASIMEANNRLGKLKQELKRREAKR